MNVAYQPQIPSKVHPAIVITDRVGRVQWINDAFTELCGYRIKDIEGFTPGSVLQGALTEPATVEQIRSAIDCQQPFSGELMNYHANGEPYTANIDIVPVFDKQGELTAFLGFAEKVDPKPRPTITSASPIDESGNISQLVNHLIDLSAEIAEAEFAFVLHPGLAATGNSIPPAIKHFCEQELVSDQELVIDDLNVHPDLTRTQPPPIRFFAALPLAPIGGALCVADRQPKILATYQTEQLRLSADCLAHALQFSSFAHES